MTRIIAFNVNDENRPYIEAWSKKNHIDVTMTPEFLTQETLHLVEGHDGITVGHRGPFDSELFPQLKAMGIKQIAQRSAGVEIFDLEAARANDIIITGVGSYSPESIAEFVMMMTLKLLRKNRLLETHVEEHDFRWMPEIRGTTIYGKRVAILGCGAIGMMTARYFHALGAEVVGFTSRYQTLTSDYMTFVGTIEEAVQEADIVSVHLPANQSNYHLFTTALFNQMKPGAFFINTGRGELVDTAAMIEAVDRGQLAGVATDVYEFESRYIPTDQRGQDLNDPVFERLINHPRIDYTHHVAYFTDVSAQNIAEIAHDSTLEVIRTGTTPLRAN